MVQFSHHDYQSEDLLVSQEFEIGSGILTAVLILSRKAHVGWVTLKDNFKLCHLRFLQEAFRKGNDRTETAVTPLFLGQKIYIVSIDPVGACRFYRHSEEQTTRVSWV